jgi:hypothetical protein
LFQIFPAAAQSLPPHDTDRPAGGIVHAFALPQLAVQLRECVLNNIFRIRQTTGKAAGITH